MASSLYAHIPFCLTKCPYCSFISSPQKSQEFQNQYVLALIKELEIAKQSCEPSPLKTIYIGGGTPTLLSETNLSELLYNFFNFKGVEATAEVTIEANPRTIDKSKLNLLKSLGVTRLSIGIQSFDDDELRFLGRPYKASDAEKIITLAQDTGFENLSLDLMYGLQGQTAETWKSSLEKAISFDPKHLSIYQLTIEEETPFSEKLNSGKISLPEEDIVEEIDTITTEYTRSAQIHRYEISNYAKLGYESLHNENYWKNHEYYGLGAGAVEYIAGERRFKIEDVESYIEHVFEGREPVKVAENLLHDESFRETIVMGLRMVKGVNLSEVEERFGVNVIKYYGSRLTRLIQNGSIEIESNMMKLTDFGMKFGNSVMADLV